MQLASSREIPERALAMLMSGELSLWLWHPRDAAKWYRTLELCGAMHVGMLVAPDLGELSQFWETRRCIIPGHDRCIPFLGGHIVLFENDGRRAE